MKRTIGIGIFIALAAVLAVSCQREKMDPLSFDKDGAISLSSYRQQVFTRADVDMFDFKAKTKYTLLAVDHASPNNWQSGKGFASVPQYGEEQVASNGAHSIKYEPINQFHKGKSLDFYGLAYNEEGSGDPTLDAPVLDTPIADGAHPTITIQTNSQNSLLDLMHCNDDAVKARTSADGVITMPFQHALSALNFTIAKQDEEGDPVQDKQLRNVKVTKLTLKNVGTKGTMDVVTGVWTPEQRVDRVIFDASTDGGEKTISTTPEVIGPTDMLVFPTYGEQVSVEIELSGLEQYQSGSGSSAVYGAMNRTFDGTGLVVSGGKCTINYDLRLFDDVNGTDIGALKFERNHKYQMSIFVMRDNVRIVAISPQVYEWQEVPLDPVTDPRVATLGQPITFGGTVWMDRNLGAKSADCEGDWWHTLGYYWEYGRNIPFILDIDVILANGYQIVDNILSDRNGNPIHAVQANNPSYPNYLVYTWDQNGKKVSKIRTDKTLKELKGNRTDYDGNYIAIEPGDKGEYSWVSCTGTADGGNGWSVWYDRKGDVADAFMKDRWEMFSDDSHRPLLDQQPVPKGWRLPNAKDVYSIMPEETFDWFYTSARFVEVGVIANTKDGHGDDVVPFSTGRRKTGGLGNGPTNAYKYVGDYNYQFFYGNIEVNKNATGNTSAPLRNSDFKTRLYGIKHQGTAKAYRYMIEVNESNVTGGRYARFYQYPTKSTDKFTATKDSNNNPVQWNLHQFDWDHPSAYIDFPVQGEIYGNQGEIHHMGSQLKLRLQNYYNDNNNYCMKLSNAGTGFMSTYHTTTVSTRLVRDI